MSVRRALTAGMLAAGLAVGVTGCGSDSPIKPDTRAAGRHAACSAGKARVDDIQASADAARAVALLIRDVGPTQGIRDLAAQVAKHPSDGSLRRQLSAWLAKNCD